MGNTLRPRGLEGKYLSTQVCERVAVSKASITFVAWVFQRIYDYGWSFVFNRQIDNNIAITMLVYVWQNARASSVLNRKNRSKLDRHSSINSLPGWFPEKRCRLFSPIAWETEGWLWGNLGRKIRYYLAKAHTIKGVGHEMKDETISRLFVHEVFETSSEWKIVNFPPSVQHSGISVPFVRLYTFQYIMCFRIIGIKRRHEKSRCVCSRDATISKAFQMSLGRVIDWMLEASSAG